MHHQQIAARDGVDGDIGDGVAIAAVRGPRRAIDQRPQVALRPCDGDVLQQVAAGIHHGDNGTREALAERERPAHGQQHHRVDAHAPGGQIPGDGDGEPDDDGESAADPDPGGQGRVIEPPGCNAAHEAEQGKPRKAPAQYMLVDETSHLCSRGDARSAGEEVNLAIRHAPSRRSRRPPGGAKADAVQISYNGDRRGSPETPGRRRVHDRADEPPTMPLCGASSARTAQEDYFPARSFSTAAL